MLALLIALLLQTVPFQPPPPELVAAQRRVNNTGEAYGRCLMAAALDRSATVTDDYVLFEAALESCPDEEAAAVGAYVDYLRLVGMEATPQQVREIYAAERPALRQRILGCVAVSRAAASGDGPRPTC